MTTLKIGADPEVFLKKDGRFVSAHGLIPGTKAEPHAVNRGAVQVDGMAAEFNIDPATTEDEFYENITSVFNTLQELVPDHELAIEPYAEFDKDIMESVPAEALEFGCDPDFNPYDKVPYPAPEVPEDCNFRVAGGHVHLGWTEGMDINDPEHVEACQMMAQQLDYYLGMCSRMFDPDNKRRQMYGRAGAFRPKPYGMEYRALSNAWLKDERLVRWVFRSAQKAFNDLVDGKSMFNEAQYFAEGCINKDDWGPCSNRVIGRVIKHYLGTDNPQKLLEA